MLTKEFGFQILRGANSAGATPFFTDETPAIPEPQWPNESATDIVPVKIPASDGMLNTIDSSLLGAFASGPSSLIDQDVVSALNNLKDHQNQPTFWKLVVNPKAAYEVLTAFWGETSAYANARRAIAKSVLTQVRLGAEDLQRDTMISYMRSLRNTLAPMLPEFCNQYGIEQPPANSIAEMIQLLKLNHAIVCVAKYQQMLAEQMEKVIKERATTESALVLSDMRNDTLPSLIESQGESFPLARKAVFQKTGHAAGMIGGIITSIPAGLIGGAIMGIFVGLEAGVKWVAEKSQTLGSKTSSWIRSRFHRVG